MTRFKRRLRPRQRRQTERHALLQSFWNDAQWPIIGALVLTALILGFVGFYRYESQVGGSTAFWDVLYRDLQLFVLESGALEVSSAIPVSLQIARLLAPAVAGVAVVRALAPLFRDQYQLLRFRITRGHVVVCGLSNKGLRLASSLRQRGYRVVAIEQDEGNEHVLSCRLAGVPVLIGDATETAILSKAGVRRAGHVIAVCSDEGVNAEIAVGAHRLAAKRTKPLICLVDVVDPHLCSLLQARYLAAPDPASFRLDFFNTDERGAQALLLRHPAFPDEDPPEPGPSPHMLIVGLGRLGTSLAVQAVRNWQTGDHASDRCLHITVVDAEAEAKVNDMLLRNAQIPGSCVLNPITVDVRSSEFELCEAFEERQAVPVTAAYVCFDNDARSMETALVLHNKFRGRRVPIVMRAATETGLPALLGPRTGDEFEDVHAFALLDRTCDPDLILGGTDELIARALHDEYVNKREEEGWRYDAEYDEARRLDPSLAPWVELDESLRESNRDQAAQVAVKLSAIGCELEAHQVGREEAFSFTPEEVELLAQKEHERWEIDRRRNGWSLGPKDLVRKRSPYLVPWSELDEEVKEYDRLFVLSLPTILAKLGHRIVRTERRLESHSTTAA